MSGSSSGPIDLRGALVDGFASAAEQHGEATADGDHERANKAFRTLSRLALQIEGRRSETVAIVDELYLRPHPSVRSWAAVLGLSVSPSKAIEVLQDVANEYRGLVGFGAEMLIAEYNAGRFKKPW